jgi:hypothetical protein
MCDISQLLQQIANNTSRDDSLWIAAVTGGAAILGAVVTAIFSYFVAKRTAETQQNIETKRLYATIITTERLRWLQDIRQRLSHLYTQLDMQYNQLKRPVQQGQQANAQAEFDKFSMEIMEQTNNITLMLNPSDPDQEKLAQSLQDKQAFLLQCFTQRSTVTVQFNDQQYAATKQAAFDALIGIGVETWKQIKELE